MKTTNSPKSQFKALMSEHRLEKRNVRNDFNKWREVGICGSIVCGCVINLNKFEAESFGVGIVSYKIGNYLCKNYNRKYSDFGIKRKFN